MMVDWKGSNGFDSVDKVETIVEKAIVDWRERNTELQKIPPLYFLY